MNGKLTINDTEAEELFLPCIQCTGKTVHKIIASARISYEEADGFWWFTEYQIVQCLGCKTISFRTADANCMETEYVNGKNEPLFQDKLYPSRIEGRKEINTKYLPASIKRIYRETLLALSTQAPVLAGIGLRTLLEAVCKEKEAVGKDLLQRIDNLTASGILTPASAAILHKIRTLGNKAAHEVKPHTEKQLSVAMDVVEHLLVDVYILPMQVETEFKD